MAVLTILLVISGNLLKNAYKENGALQGRVMGLEEAVKFQKEVGALNVKFNRELADITEKSAKESAKRTAQINMDSLTARSRSERSPLKFGDSVHIALARIMCRIQADTDPKAFSACNSAAPETFLGPVSLTITVTDETIEDWKRGCDIYKEYRDLSPAKRKELTAQQKKDKEGLKDLCEPISITGFTPEGLSIMMRYLEQIQDKSLQKSLYIESMRKLINKLQDPNFGKVK